MHPLDTTLLSRLVGPSRASTIAFSFVEDVQMPIEVLQALNVDVFADSRFEMDVIMEIAGRLEVNSWEEYQDLEDDSSVLVTGVNSCSSLLNHCCVPNVQWESDADSGFMIVKALRPISAHEELYISYLSDEDTGQGREHRVKMLQTWTENGQHHCVACFPNRVSQSNARDASSFSHKRRATNHLKVL